MKESKKMEYTIAKESLTKADKLIQELFINVLGWNKDDFRQQGNVRREGKRGRAEKKPVCGHIQQVNRIDPEGINYFHIYHYFLI